MSSAAAAACRGKKGGGGTDKILAAAAWHGRRRPLPCVLWRIHTMLRRFGDRSTGGSVPSPSQLDRARTRDRVGSGIISGT